MSANSQTLRAGSCIASVLTLLAAPAAAHYPEETVHKLFQFPDDHVPVMDGDLGDWDVLPDEYLFDLSHFTQHKEQTSADANPTDLNIIRSAVAWNDELNRLYFMAEVYDDVVRFHKDDPDSLDHPFTRLTGSYVHGADIFEISIDADHGAEDVVGYSQDNDRELRFRSAFTQNYHLYMPPLNRTYWHWLWGVALWTKDPAWSAVGWTFPGEHASSGTVTYECYLTPFDELDAAGPDKSVLHDLKENAVVGLAWAFLDADTSATSMDAFWSMTGDVRMYCMGDYLSDFELMPVDASLFPESD